MVYAGFMVYGGFWWFMVVFYGGCGAVVYGGSPQRFQGFTQSVPSVPLVTSPESQKF